MTMSTRSFIPLMLTVTLWSATAPAAYGESLPRLWNKVVAAHPKVKGAQARLELARTREAQARANFYPRIGVQYDYARARNEALRITDPQTTRQGDAYLRLNLFNGFTDVARKDSAMKEVSATREDLADAKEDLALALAEQYVSVLTLSRQVINAQNLVDDLNVLLETVRASVRLGRNPESDLIQATTKVLEARSNLSDAQGRLSGARARLHALVGGPVGELSEPNFDEQLQARPLADLMALAREGTPQLAAARLRARQAADEVTAVKGDLYPKIALEGRKNFERSGPAELVSGLEREGLVQFTYEYSLGRAPYRRVDEARARQLAAEALAHEIEIELEGQIGETRETLLEYVALAPQLEDRQRAAAGVFEAYRWQFNAGRRSLLDLITVREDQYFSGEAVTANLRNRLLGGARIHRLLGQLHTRLEDPLARAVPAPRPTGTGPGAPDDELLNLPLKMDRSPIQR